MSKKSAQVFNWEDYQRDSGDEGQEDLFPKGNISQSSYMAGKYVGTNVKSQQTFTTRCYETHKPLKIVVDDKEYLIYGGSCGTPVVKDADIYVGFERGMAESTKAYPWNGGASFYFPILDGNVPSSVVETKGLLKYLADSLIAGKKVHIGCIGGHGRTGTIMAALVTYMTGNKNSIEYVRTNYCEKVVESNTQIEWLHKHFGIDKVKPSKSYMGGTGTDPLYSTYGKGGGVSRKYSDVIKTDIKAPNDSVLEDTIKPVRVKGNIWGF